MMCDNAFWMNMLFLLRLYLCRIWNNSSNSAEIF